MSDNIISAQLLSDIRQLLTRTCQTLVQTVNTAMVQTYWHVGHIIVEHEQQGQARAEYGKQVLVQLVASLTVEFGKGFDASNLRNMRRFYLAYPIQETLSLKLSWSHYKENKMRITKKHSERNCSICKMRSICTICNCF